MKLTKKPINPKLSKSLNRRLLQYVGENQYFTYHKIYTTITGNDRAGLILSYLIYKASYYNNFFYITINQMIKDLGYSKDIQHYNIKKLITEGFITKNRKKTYGKRHFVVNFEIILNALIEYKKLNSDKNYSVYEKKDFNNSLKFIKKTINILDKNEIKTANETTENSSECSRKIRKDVFVKSENRSEDKVKPEANHKQSPIELIKQDSKKQHTKQVTSNLVKKIIDEKLLLLISQLIKRGISEYTAKKLVCEFETILIQNQITYFDFLINEKHYQMKNKGGFLRKSIEENYTIPVDYISPEKKQKKKKLIEKHKKEKLEKRKKEDENAIQKRIKELEKRKNKYSNVQKYNKLWSKIMKTIKQSDNINGTTKIMLTDTFIQEIRTENAIQVYIINVLSKFHKKWLDEHISLLEKITNKKFRFIFDEQIDKQIKSNNEITQDNKPIEKISMIEQEPVPEEIKKKVKKYIETKRCIKLWKQILIRLADKIGSELMEFWKQSKIIDIQGKVLIIEINDYEMLGLCEFRSNAIKKAMEELTDEIYGVRWRCLD